MGTNTADREIVIERLINAPRELVYSAWTEPEHLIHWWGPRGFTNTFHEIAVKPGGVWRFMMHGPNNMDFPNKVVFSKVVKNELLEYVHTGEDEDDSHAFHAMITFVAQGDKTLLTMRSVFSTAEERNRVVKEVNAVEGGNQTLDKLQEYIDTIKTNN